MVTGYLKREGLRPRKGSKQGDFMNKEAEQLLGQAQIYQQQIQNIMAQKSAMAMELNDIKKALEEIEKTSEKHVYKLSGPLLIKMGIKDVKKDLTEREETISMRVKTYEKQEEKLKEKIEGLRSKITQSQPKAG